MTLHVPISKYMTPNPVSVQQDAELGDAVTLINTHNIRHLPVLDGDKLVGLVSERDLGLIESMLPSDWEAVSVAEAMTPAPFAVSENTMLGEVAQRMALERYGSAVVLDGEGRVRGIFTTVDAMRALAHACGMEA